MIIKRKKQIVLICVFLLIICFITFIFSFKYKNTAWNLLDNMDSSAVQINGWMERNDYPYGYNVGIIEDEEVGKTILITPETSIDIRGFASAKTSNLSVSYEIHPWVAASSDGALLNIEITGDTLIKQNYTFDVTDKEQTQTISLKEYAGHNVIQIKVYVTNADGNNENCDWVILKDFCIRGGVFETEQSKFSKEGYVKSATYFANEWPINFWNSEMDNIDTDFQQIKNDGFESIILCIPWREFQPQTDPIQYNDYAFQNLDDVMKKANQWELGVYVRIGYLWDYYNDENDIVVDRYCRLMGDPLIQNAWYDYVSKMYETLKKYPQFRGGFLTWEDFYNNLGLCDQTDLNIRRENALIYGYQNWVATNYNLSEYNDKYSTNYSSYEEILMPSRNDPSMQSMYEFYDTFLNSILLKSQEQFPDLSMEVRLDWDVFYKDDGSMDYYTHIDTFSCMNSSFTTIMYGIPMGFENKGERVGFRDALHKTAHILSQYKQQNSGKPVYIDQFIFADNTPAFKNNAQIKESELNDYLKNISDTLIKYSDGYGIWTYRNYCANMLYNSQFALEEKNWDSTGAVLFEKQNSTGVCTLKTGGSISQIVPNIRNHFDNDIYFFEFEVTHLKIPGEITVTMGDSKQILYISELGRYELNFPKNSTFDLSFESNNCYLSIDNLKLYSQIQQGFLYDTENNELQCIEGIRNLNNSLN